MNTFAQVLARPSIRLRVYGTPKGQPRARSTIRKFGAKVRSSVYDPGTANGWKSAIAIAARPHLQSAPISGAIYLEADVLFPRPGRLNRKKDDAARIRHTVKPDRDNVEKAILDALTAAGLFVDDCQVCDGPVRKWYAAKGEAPGAEIVVSVIEGRAAPAATGGQLFAGAL